MFLDYLFNARILYHQAPLLLEMGPQMLIPAASAHSPPTTLINTIHNMQSNRDYPHPDYFRSSCKDLLILYVIYKSHVAFYKPRKDHRVGGQEGQFSQQTVLLCKREGL